EQFPDSPALSISALTTCTVAREQDAPTTAQVAATMAIASRLSSVTIVLRMQSTSIATESRSTMEPMITEAPTSLARSRVESTTLVLATRSSPSLEDI